MQRGHYNFLAQDKVSISGNAVNLMAATSSGESTHQSETKNHTIGAQLSGSVWARFGWRHVAQV